MRQEAIFDDEARLFLLPAPDAADPAVTGAALLLRLLPMSKQTEAAKLRLLLLRPGGSASLRSGRIPAATHHGKRTNLAAAAGGHADRYRSARLRRTALHAAMGRRGLRSADLGAAALRSSPSIAAVRNHPFAVPDSGLPRLLLLRSIVYTDRSLFIACLSGTGMLAARHHALTLRPFGVRPLHRLRAMLRHAA